MEIDSNLAQSTILLAVYLGAIAMAPIARRIANVSAANAEREPTIDGMRGLAAIGVVACHVNQYLVAFLGFKDPAFGNHLGIFGVQMFFALTAYLFTDRALSGKLDPESFYRGRLRRIMPLYIAVCIAALVVAWCYSIEAAPAAQMTEEAIRVFLFGFWKVDAISFCGINMLSLVGIAWTLSYEWIFYLLLLPGYCLWRVGTAAKAAFIGVVAVFAVRDFSLQGEQIVWVFFLPGIVAALLKAEIAQVNRTLLLTLPIPALVLIFWLPGFWTAGKLGLCLIIFCALVSGRPRWLSWRPLRVLGTISYSIYLTQYLVLFPAMQIVYTSTYFAAIEPRLAMGALVVAVTVLTAAITYRFIERPWMTTAPRNSRTISPPRAADIGEGDHLSRRTPL
jgi:peptidoglycan/LPS O-acetylase OafA/YrhL